MKTLHLSRRIRPTP